MLYHQFKVRNLLYSSSDPAPARIANISTSPGAAVFVITHGLMIPDYHRFVIEFRLYWRVFQGAQLLVGIANNITS